MKWELQKRVKVLLIKNDIWESIETFAFKPHKPYIEQKRKQNPKDIFQVVKVEDL